MSLAIKPGLVTDQIWWLICEVGLTSDHGGH